MSTTSSPVQQSPEPWADVVGQDEVVEALRAALESPVHAYLFVGPRGTGKGAAARSFAAGLLSDPEAGADDPARAVRLALADQHPDLTTFDRVGAFINVDQADQIIRRASLSATEGRRKVLVLNEFHLVQPGAAGKLLKTIEEPPSGTFFVVLAEEVTPDLVTIASRCVRLDFRPVPTADLVTRLVADGVAQEVAGEIAVAAHGDLGRARLLASDERFAIRLATWRDVPGQLDGTGHTASVIGDRLRGVIADAAASLVRQQQREAEAMTERIERYGERGSGAKALEERHKRELRRLRADELRLGLAELARAYRDELAVAGDPAPLLDALDVIQATAESMIRNPNEELLLLGLLFRLPSLN